MHKTDLQSTKPLAGEFWSTTNRLVPHNWEICDATEILRNANGVVEVDDNMPPATRHKYCLSGTLQYLNLPHHMAVHTVTKNDAMQNCQNRKIIC